MLTRSLTARRLAELRLLRGWTQEELAERSGLSVRTIRNLELGQVRNPRRSSMDLLAQALGMDAAQKLPAGTDGQDAAVRWRGPRPPSGPVVGASAERGWLAHAVRGNRLTTVLGPGGVGKTRLALDTAARMCGHFTDGVVVVELGDLPTERLPHGNNVEMVRRRVLRHLDLGDGREAADARVLVVLDNAEHVPAATVQAARDLLASHPGMNILVTARRRLTERLGVNHEIKPLPVDEPRPGAPAPAVELVLRHGDAHADLGRDLPLITELCRRLGGLPRYLEFAAERLRTLPVRMLLADGPSAALLSSDDHALLRHQRSVSEGIRWSLDLLTEHHRSLITGISTTLAHRWFTAEDVAAHRGDGRRPPEVNALLLFPDLLETSLVVADPDDRYRYRLAPFVAEVLRPTADAC
ncbi:helix-turn-helix domain-containing protein [Streptomyces sp. NPDC020996]|uniref:helix-turn-helix domain-containing protein n=1 Tax=Streptomyces sp. NPDC020996 TaxID=3154791 RepID=UPI0033C42C4E